MSAVREGRTHDGTFRRDRHRHRPGRPRTGRPARRAGRKTAIIERKRFGGTCVNVGCIPTKTLVASARARTSRERAADFGVAIDGSVRVDMPSVKARKDAVVAAVDEGVEQLVARARRMSP